MAVWSMTRGTGWPVKAAIAAGLLAALLVAAVPAAFVVGVVLMLLGHVVVGLALFGASALAAVAVTAAVAIVGMSGLRRLRKLVSRRDYRVVQLQRDEYDYK